MSRFSIEPDEFDEDTSQVGDVALKVKNNFMNILKKIWQWLIYSSANPEKLSLTLKAGVAFLVTLGLDKTIGDVVANNVLGILLNTAQIITLCGLIWGATRKIGLTIRDLKVV